MDAEDNDGQPDRATKPTTTTSGRTRGPWTSGYTGLDGSVACNRFLTSLRAALPAAVQIGEALAFTKLLMLHPDAPMEHRKLRGALWAAASVDECKPDEVASHLRELAGLVLEHSGYTASGSVLELGLSALALQFDDTASHRMECVELGILFGGVKTIALDDVAPSWKRDGSPCFISPGLLRPWVAEHIQAICDLAERDATAPSAPSEIWSCRDVECALLALRMQYGVFRTPLSGDLHADLEQDFVERGLPIWGWLQRVLINWPEADIARSELLTDPAWHLQAQREVRRVIRSAWPLDGGQAWEDGAR